MSMKPTTTSRTQPKLSQTSHQKTVEHVDQRLADHKKQGAR